MERLTVEERDKIIKLRKIVILLYRHALACDLTPLDFFQWSYEKYCVYANNPQ